MTYTEFKTVYSWMLKHYPETSSLFGRNISITCTTTRESKSGHRWARISDEVETFTPENYFNTVDAIPFFRNMGGAERVSNAYTKYGYIPVKIVSISPDGSERITRTFLF